MLTTLAHSDLEDILHGMNKQVNKLQLVDVFTNVLRRKVFTKVLVDVFTQVLARYDKRNVFRPGGLHWLAFHSRDLCNDLNCILQYTESETLSREVQMYHTHVMIYEHPCIALRSIVMLQLHWETSSLSLLKRIHYRAILRLVTFKLFIYVCTTVCVFLCCIVVEFVCVAPVGWLITLPVSAHLPLPWAPSQLAPPSSTSDPFNIFTQHVFVCVCLSLS